MFVCCMSIFEYHEGTSYFNRTWDCMLINMTMIYKQIELIYYRQPYFGQGFDYMGLYWIVFVFLNKIQ